MKSNIRGPPNYAWIEVDYTVLLLLKVMQEIMFKLEGHKNQAYVLHGAKASLNMFRQGKEVSNPLFLELFQSKVSVGEQFGDWIRTNPGLVLDDYPGIATDQ